MEISTPIRKRKKLPAVHLKCLVLPLRSRTPIIKLQQKDGYRCLSACWFNVRGRGNVLAPKPLLIAPGSMLWLFASAFTIPGHPEWHYYFLLQEQEGHIACSCSRGWHAQFTQMHCEHIKTLAALLKMSAPVPDTSQLLMLSASR